MVACALDDGLRSLYARTVLELRCLGRGVGVEVSAESEMDSWDFLEASGWGLPGEVVLTAVGHLRLVWSLRGGEHLSLRFSGRGWAVYVWRRRGSGRFNWVVGVLMLPGGPGLFGRYGAECPGELGGFEVVALPRFLLSCSLRSSEGSFPSGPAR